MLLSLDTHQVSVVLIWALRAVLICIVGVKWNPLPGLGCGFPSSHMTECGFVERAQSLNLGFTSCHLSVTSEEMI